jgi:hypothetical protein
MIATLATAAAVGTIHRRRPLIATDRRSTAANRKPIKPRENVAAQSSPRLIWVAARTRGRSAASPLAVIPEAKMQKLARRFGLSKPACMRP